MDAQRAQEICNSPSMIDVTYNGANVYIEHVDRQNEKVTIHPLADPNNKLSVSIGNLTEH